MTVEEDKTDKAKVKTRRYRTVNKKAHVNREI
jgi:hypothetical protein